MRSTLPNAGWILVELDQEVLQRRILPDLAHRYFQGTDGLDYEVAVVAGGSERRVIYSSDPGFGTRRVADADGRMDVFGRSATSGGTVRVFHRTTTDTGPTACGRRELFPLLRQFRWRRIGSSWSGTAGAGRSDCSWPRCAGASSP